MEKRFIFAMFALLVGCPTLAAAHMTAKLPYGEPGKAGKISRVVEVTMTDKEGEMRFTPDHIAVARGEQIKFIVRNKGTVEHEFVLGRAEDNKVHAAMMAQMPDMKHVEANALTLPVGKSAEMLWRFGEAGTFEFACLLPGHYEAGMHGEIMVK